MGNTRKAEEQHGTKELDHEESKSLYRAIHEKRDSKVHKYGLSAGQHVEVKKFQDVRQSRDGRFGDTSRMCQGGRSMRLSEYAWH